MSEHPPMRQLLPSYIGAVATLVLALDATGLLDRVLDAILPEPQAQAPLPEIGEAIAMERGDAAPTILGREVAADAEPNYLLLILVLAALLVGIWLLARLYRYLWNATLHRND